jgi:hypothetical protein
MSNATIDRINGDYIQTLELIAREEAYSEHLQKKNYLRGLHKHAQKLKALIDLKPNSTAQALNMLKNL